MQVDSWPEGPAGCGQPRRRLPGVVSPVGTLGLKLRRPRRSGRSLLFAVGGGERSCTPRSRYARTGPAPRSVHPSIGWRSLTTPMPRRNCSDSEGRKVTLTSILSRQGMRRGRSPIKTEQLRLACGAASSLSTTRLGLTARDHPPGSGGEDKVGRHAPLSAPHYVTPQIPHLASARGVTDCFLGHGDAPSG